MKSLIVQAFVYIRENDLKTIIAAIHSKDAHPVVQFIKYGICGGIATVAHMGTWLILVRTVLPAWDGMEIDGEPISDEIRFRNTSLANVIAWFFGNVTAYITNVLWVFEGGRHSRWLEFLYFSMVSGISFVAGIVGGPLLIKLFGVPTWFSQVTFLITSVMVNYLCRKFFVFKG